MKSKLQLRLILGFLCLSLVYITACQNASDEEKLYYALETNGVICGYHETIISNIEENGNPLILAKENVKSIATALGASVSTKIQAESRIDPETGQPISSEFDLDQGSFTLHISTTIEGNTARITQSPGWGEKEIALPPDVIIENTYFFPHLLKDFAENKLDSKRYKILDIFDRRIIEVTYTSRGTEQIKLAGNMYNAIVLDVLNHEIGAKSRIWVNAENGYFLKAELATQSRSLADKSVERKLKRANVDDILFAKVGVAISDIKAISYMKVKATLDPIGYWITPESLNVSGQSFDGTVENNLVQGIFEVSHKKYDGSNPPPFPPDFSENEELQPFISPEDFIESDDPVLTKKAKALTDGSSDSWEAAKRLGKWVAEEIGYDIPGGASARNTYDLRRGECGAHSRLFAAFCRAVGIPARVIWGCMYVPSHNGSFGQHGWNEIYMGKAGWIPIDTTAQEIDYADSGHIRLGIVSSKHTAFHPKQMEILDFHAGSQKFGEVTETSIPEEYKPYIGKYSGPRGVLKVLVQHGSLAVDVPGKMVFELRDPDEKDSWFFKLTQDVNVSFQKDDSDKVTGMTIENKARFPKKAQTQEIKRNIPEKFRPYLGKYVVPMENAEIRVFYRKNNLALTFPDGKSLGLEGPDEEGIWKAKSRGLRFSFVADDDGTVKVMILYETIYSKRIE